MPRTVGSFKTLATTECCKINQSVYSKPTLTILQAQMMSVSTIHKKKFTILISIL